MDRLTFLCDNQSVVTNASNLVSTLTKRHNSICYHRVREASGAGYVRVGWIEGKSNRLGLGMA